MSLNDSFKQLQLFIGLVVLLHELFKSMEAIQGKYYLRGNDLREDYEFNGAFIDNGKNLYEVVRVIDGIILFLDEHLERLYNSAKKSEVRPFVEHAEIKKLLKRLLMANHLHTGNIKIVFHYGNGEWEKNFKAYQIPFTYPSEVDYNSGVKAGILRFTRPDPEIKTWLGEFRENVNHLKNENSWFETILQNENGTITEGSQSNLFVIKGNKIITAPSGLVLDGITRKKIMTISEDEGFEVKEKSFDSTFLLSSDAVFLTGTSPKVLPVRQIGEKEFHVNHKILTTLIKKYDQLIGKYIQERKDAV
jgi:branched-chain amino acid aminotransferase